MFKNKFHLKFHKGLLFNNLHSKNMKFVCNYIFLFISLICTACLAPGNSIDRDGEMVSASERDKDSDGIPYFSDNCPDIYNPNQFDSDENAEGDACDSTIIYFVSPSGDDSNLGTETEPFRTIQRARDIVRRKTAIWMNRNIVILIRGGNYYVTSPICFGMYDGGRNGYKIFYRNYPGETPILIGGETIVNWTPVDDFIYKAKIGNKRFNTLYENSSRAVIAHEPDGYYALTESPDVSSPKNTFFYNHDILPPEFNYIGAEVVIFPSYNFMMYLDNIKDLQADYIENKSKIILEKDASLPIMSKNRFIIQNVKEFLDEPGEFYIDYPAETLFYRPKRLPINEQNIIAPAVSAIFKVEGKNEDRVVHDIVFSGLSIGYTDDVRHNVTGWVSDNGAITVINAESVIIKNMHFYDIGTNAIFMLSHALNNFIYNNIIEKVGLSGISIHGKGRSDHNIIANNTIQDIGELYVPGNGISLNYSGYNKIYNNKITRTSYAGIFIGGNNCEVLTKTLGDHINCTDNETSYADPNNYRYHNRTKYNEIKFNDISQFMLNADDGGGIYAWATGEGNIIDNNIVYGAGIINRTVKEIYGIYIDDGADYLTVQNNIVYDLNNNSNKHTSRTVPLYIKGIYNKIINNIFISNDCDELMRQYAYGTVPSHHLYFRNNIFYRNTNMDNCRSPLLWTLNNYSGNTISSSDQNIIYENNKKVSSDIFILFWNGKQVYLSLEDWKKTPYGFDRNTLFLNPQFTDETSNDYTVTNQQILSIGFQNIDVSKVGYQDSYDIPLNGRK